VISGTEELIEMYRRLLRTRDFDEEARKPEFRAWLVVLP
jgi:hypothetical protein